MCEFCIQSSTTIFTTEEDMSRLQTETWWKVIPELSLAKLGFRNTRNVWKGPLFKETKARPWSYCVSLLSSVLKKKKKKWKAKCFPSSVSNSDHSDPLLAAATHCGVSASLWKPWCCTCAMGHLPKAAGAHNTQAQHLYSTAFNPDIPAQPFSVPKKGHSSYMKILKDIKSSYPTVFLIWFTLS